MWIVVEMVNEPQHISREQSIQQHSLKQFRFLIYYLGNQPYTVEVTEHFL